MLAVIASIFLLGATDVPVTDGEVWNEGVEYFRNNDVTNALRVLRPLMLSKMLKEGTLFITPGVRPAGSAVGDQKRVATPAEAVRDGATHLVVGRPILAASDPVAAAKAIREEMNI